MSRTLLFPELCSTIYPVAFTFVLEIETTMVSPSIPVVTKYRVVSEIVNKIVSAVA